MKTYSVASFTDIGLRRTINEDHILVGRFIKNRGGMGLTFSTDDDFLAVYGLVFAVADGIGGARAGEVASRLALQVFDRHFYSFEKAAAEDAAFVDALTASGKRANDTILQMASARPECSDMGCTLAGVCLTPSGYHVFSAGDSRVYRFRRYLQQLTEDDTVTGLAVRLGTMTGEEAEASNQRHTLINSLGSSSFQLRVSQTKELRDDERLLISSDGLHDLVPRPLIEDILKTNADPVQAVQALVEEAKRQGGHDNISVILIQADIQETIAATEVEGTPSSELASEFKAPQDLEKMA
ncbi:MAG: serine/threonine-protein phosphatase [Deltaproteobacteria bacterium]|nr:serine/threonine-protein phosphatase [Deltaproteobacteria bacterium]